MTTNALDLFLSNINPDQMMDIYIDGACSGNPGVGGWGVYGIQSQHTFELSGGALNTTNNRMEMMAAIEALKIIPGHMALTLYTDSIYLRDGITKWIDNWKKNHWKTTSKTAVKNQDLWMLLDEVAQQHHLLNWKWVKGHNGNVGNEKADGLARKGIIACRMA